MSARARPTSPPRAVRLLQAAWLASSFDRFVVGPLLVSMTVTFGATLQEVVAAAGWYFLCYGLAQPLWGLSCDRLGRIPTMRLSLAVAATAGVVAAAAPTLLVLVVARAVVGACIGAVIPASLVYVGDTVPGDRRQQVLSELQSAQAVGTTAAIACGGVLAAALSWRLALLAPVLVAGALVVALRRLPEPARAPGASGGVRVVLRHRSARVVLVLGLLEGAALLGFLTYFAPALERSGSSPALAGLVVATYGVGLLVASQVVRRVVGRTSGAVLVGSGSVLPVAAYVVAAAAQGVAAVGVAALLVGAAWAPLHSTMQAWATQVVPSARASMVSAYAAMLFVGSGVATAAVAPLAQTGRWAALFGAGAVLALVCGAAATAARARAEAHVRTAPAPPR